MKEGGERPSSWRSSFSTVLAIGAGVVLTLLVAGTEEYAKIAAWGTDLLFRARPAVQTDDVVIVDINDDDVTDVLRGTTSLSRDELGALLRRILAAGPRVVGVLIDGSVPDLPSLRAELRDEKVVWGTRVWWREREKKFVMRSKGPPAVSVGPAVLWEDRDGVTRTFARSLPASTGMIPSFSTVLLNAGGARSLDEGSGATCRRLIDFSLGPGHGSPFPVLSARWILDRPPGSGSDKIFSGAYVLVGEDYGDAVEYRTSIGPLSVAQTWAQVIYGELRGATVCRPGEGLMLLWALVDGLLLTLLFSWAKFWPSIGIGILLSLALAAVVSVRIYGDLGHVTYFLPMLILMLVNRIRRALG